jgi:hypothetical protein
MKKLIISALCLALGFNTFASENPNKPAPPSGRFVSTTGGAFALGFSAFANSPLTPEGGIKKGDPTDKLENKISITNLLAPPSGAGGASAAPGCACKPIQGRETTNGFATSLTKCGYSQISIYSCDNVPGAILNDIASTTKALEYDYAYAATTMGASTTQTLVEAGGSCFMRLNLNNTSIQYSTNNGDIGYRRYNCPVNWHVPSLCEIYYLYFSSSETPPVGTNLLYANTALNAPVNVNPNMVYWAFYDEISSIRTLDLFISTWPNSTSLPELQFGGFTGPSLSQQTSAAFRCVHD